MTQHAKTDNSQTPPGAEAHNGPVGPSNTPPKPITPTAPRTAATGPTEAREGTPKAPTEPADRWKPTRLTALHRRETGGLTPAQLALADDLHTRALALRAASEEGLSIREAVNLAAFQLGLEAPTEGETR